MTQLTETEPVTPELRESSPRPRRSWSWLVWLAFFGALGYGAYRYNQANQQKQQALVKAQSERAARRALPVVAVPARAGDMPVYLRGLGTVAAFNSVAVKTRVDGQLTAIHFQEGQFVRQGDLLAEIDPRPFQVQLEQAQGQLARDQAQLKDAQVNLHRYELLWQEKIIPRQQLDTQAASVGQYEGVIEADKAAIDAAKLQLTYCRIIAPISGRIGLRLVDVGNIVHASDATGLVMIAQLQPIAVLFTIPADSLPPVLAKLRDGVRLRVDAYDRDDRNRIASGSLLTVDNQIDPATGTSRLKAVFANDDSALFPNQFVNCRLLLDTKHGVILVPASAIQHGPQGTYVYIVTPQKTAVMRPVTGGTTEGNEVSIEQGLKSGDLVVIDGQDKLQDGTRVDIRAPSPARNPAGRKPASRPGAGE